jgi:hypothetical protein
MRCGDLYRLVARRFAPYMKVPVKELIRHRQQQRQQQQQQLRHTTSGTSLSSLAANNAVGHGAYPCVSASNTLNVFVGRKDRPPPLVGPQPYLRWPLVTETPGAAQEEYPVNLRLDSIRSADTDEVVGGAIPEAGFTLRLISAGGFASCSHCTWLEHCDGMHPYCW